MNLDLILEDFVAHISFTMGLMWQEWGWEPVDTAG